MAQLNNDELRLCDLIWFGPARGHNSATIFDIHYPSERTTVTRQQKFRRINEFKKRQAVIDRLEELRGEATQTFRSSIEALPDQLMNLAMNPGDRFAFLPHEIIERRNKNTGEILGYAPAPVVNDPSEVPEDMFQYVKEFVFEPELGKFVVVPRELVGEKTRAKYVDMLAKMGGAYAPERLEVTGREGKPVETINHDMSAVDAAEIYRKSIKGES